MHFVHIYVTVIDLKKQQPLAKQYKIWYRYVNTHILNRNLNFCSVLEVRICQNKCVISCTKILVFV